MKITLIGPFPPFRGGISDFNHSLHNELQGYHDIQRINFTTQYPKILFPGKTQYKSEADTFDNSDRQLSSINFLSWGRTARAIIKFNPEIIIFQYWMPFFSPSYSAVIRRVKRQLQLEVISICHNLTPHENKGFYKYLTKRYIQHIDKFVLMSKAVAVDLRKFEPSADAITLFHPVYELYGKHKNKKAARKSLGLNSKSIILFFGLIREYKGFDLLLKSIPLIKREIGDFKLVIAGECYEDPEKYLQIINALGIKDDIVWINEFVPDKKVSDYFCAADVLVLPYRSATQSGVTQIAYNYNIPVIITNVGGLSEIVENGITGYVVDPAEKQIAEAIIRFFKENRFEEFSENIKSVKYRYSWETFTNKLLKFSKT